MGNALLDGTPEGEQSLKTAVRSYFELDRDEIRASEDVKKRIYKRIGFRPQSERLYRVYNVIAASLLLIAAAPLLLGMSLALLITQGFHVFYRGARYGKNKEIFYIYKFRTLNNAAALSLTHDKTLPINSGAETPLGKFLRDTRLDELPQLLNVFLGDMNMCGPRPVRPEIAQIEEERIPRYAVRFTVKPGLVGPAQALMSHGTSKRFRALFNNIACNRAVSLNAEIGLLVAIAWSVIRRTAISGFIVVASAMVRAVRRCLRMGRKLMRAGHRAFLRIALDVGSCETVVEGSHEGDLLVAEIGHEQIVIPRLALAAPAAMTLRIRLGDQRVRKARILLEPSRKRDVYTYSAASPASHYIIERYLLGRTVISPSKKRRRTVAEPPLRSAVARLSFPQRSLHVTGS